MVLTTVNAGFWLKMQLKRGFNVIHSFCTVNELTKFDTTQIEEGAVACLLGIHRAGDIAAIYCTFCNESSGKIGYYPNNRKGFWQINHGGIGDYRWFGVFDTSVAADDAFTKMIKDESIKEIRAFTDLNFQKRHKYNRSNLILDFGSNSVYTKGVEPAPHNDPFCAIFNFSGTCTEEKYLCKLNEEIKELYDIFEVPDSSKFSLYSWWKCTVNNLAGKEEKELQKLLMVTEIIDEKHVRFNYKNGWSLQKGREIEYVRVEPVKKVTFKNMCFYGNPHKDDEVREKSGAHPIALEFAVNCDIYNVHGYETYWPVILRRYNVHYITENCGLTNPTEVIVGGTGYLTQQIHCLYGSVRNCTASNARHLNDFTSSAYCLVENCHADGDFHGGYVTHGQFEHDLTYIGNSGLISFANSGPTWGSSAKRILVKRHNGCWFLAYAKVSDLTIEDTFIAKTDNYEDCGTMLINSDGVQIRGCTADKLIFTQKSSRSQRPCIVQDCLFKEEHETVCLDDTIKMNTVTYRNNVVESKGKNHE